MDCVAATDLHYGVGRISLHCEEKSVGSVSVFPVLKSFPDGAIAQVTVRSKSGRALAPLKRRSRRCVLVLLYVVRMCARLFY